MVSKSGTFIKAKQGTVLILKETNLKNEGEMRLQEASSLVQTNVTPTNSGAGSYIVEKTGTDYRAEYNYWASPVLSLVRSDVFSVATTNRAYFYDATLQDWVWAGVSESLSPTKGVIATGKNTVGTSQQRVFSGTSGFHSGNYTLGLSYNDDGGSNSDTDNDWNLVGNPYPSGINVASFLTDNSSVIDNAVYLWNSDGNDINSTSADYAVMNTTGVTNAGGNVAPTSANVSSCQSFFVRAIGTGNVNFSNSQRTGTNNTFLRTNKADWERIWLTARHERGYENQILLGFIPDASEEDDQYDAIKLSGSSHLSFYSKRHTAIDNDDLAIQGLPLLAENESRIIPLGLNILTEGEYTFSISHLSNFSESRGVLLYDSEMDTSIDLRSQDYKLNLPVRHYVNRFSLQLVGDKITDLTNNLENGIQLFSNQNKVMVHFSKLELANSQIYIYDAIGRLLVKQTNETKLDLEFSLPQSGIYIVKIENQKGILTKKVYLGK
jgi:hypothetical protein